FDMDANWLHKRQAQLDAYRQLYSDTSRQVVSETLNVMGLSFLLQSEFTSKILSQQMNVLHQSHHRMGRIAQEKANGYYVDVGLQLISELPNNEHSVADVERSYREVDLGAYFASALEHGIIEQLQASNLVAASTVKLLQLGNTNGLKTFLLTSNNWSTVSLQL